MPSRTTFLSLAVLALAIVASACTKGSETVDRVQPSLIDKDIFEGEWWVTQTAIDVDADSSGPTWPGDMGTADLAVDKNGAMTLGRIRWVIDEDFLFAYRSFELVDGANAEGTSPSYRGQPLAAFEIEDHVDVRPQYNPVTGETQNIIEENTEDRRWFERQYMRVDWSKNHVRSFYFVAEIAGLGDWEVEDGQFYIQEGGAQGFPKSWEPQIVTVGEDPGYRFASEWPEGSDDVTHYMSFVAFMNLSPGGSCLQTSGTPCQTLSVPHRLAFLRVPPDHQYAAATQSNEDFDRFGVFRTNQRTYLGSDDVVARRCDRNVDCGIGGFCDAERHVCAGGLGEDFGETDALRYLRPRLNLFRESLTDQTCTADWECDGRFEDTPGVGGSVCDRAARRCTIPIRDRVARSLRDGGVGAVAYHLAPGFPPHLVHSAMEVVGRWNEVFMRGWRAARDLPLPRYSDVRIECQADDPTDYCFCGSPDERGGTCAGRYDPFVPPSQWSAQGVEQPYDCYVENTEHVDPVAPTSLDVYPLPQTYRYQFVGDECLLALRPNTCDWHRTDAVEACDDVVDGEGEPIDWQQLGDIRYQFVNFIDQATGLDFSGSASPLADPTTGELVVANANIVAGPIEQTATDALEFFPLLRCRNLDLGCEPGEEDAEARYLSGENLRGYFSRLGRTQRPQGLAASGSDGFTIDDNSRPALPVDVNGTLRGVMAEAQTRVDSLRGQDGRAQILSDRMRNLAGTPIEQKLMSSLGVDGMDALNRHFDQGQTHVFGLTPQTSVDQEAILEQISPFRGSGFARTLAADSDLDRELAARNACALGETIFRSRFAEYWAEAFRGRANAEASLRMQQLRARMVLAHELGHSVGLRHNFAASLDRDHYADGYFNVVMGEEGESDDLPLPQLDGFDLDQDGFLAGPEFDAYLEALRDARDERARRGAHNYTSSSVMDYAGDVADSQGLGRYDAAAAIWNHFDLREAYDLRAVEGPARTDRDGPFQGLARSHVLDRTWWRSYSGGESCTADADCPASRSSGMLRNDQPVYQRCVQNPRRVFPQEQCQGQSDCACSTFENDVEDYADLAAYFDGTNAERPYAPVTYLYCPDERTNDISWCNKDDAGESFREVIDHYRRTWEEQYPVRYYRRFRADGASGGGSQDLVRDAAKIYQHLFFRFNFEPGFSFNTGPLGFDDQFLASIDAMNWFVEIVNLPDEGAYEYDAGANLYRWLGASTDIPGADVTLLPGQGFGMWTQYQDGYFGFFRPERAGVFYDKYYALLALAIRDWRLNFTIDERYFINFYDLFQTEMTELFGGIILQDESWFAPRLAMDEDGPVVQHMSWYRGLALGECEEGGRLVPCRGSQPDVYPGAAIEGTTNEVLRTWAAILALAQFPVYYDTSFEQRLLIFKAGSGAGFDIPDIQPDGSPTCVYGSDGLGAGHFVVDPGALNGCDTADDADYVVFESNRFRTPYVAVKVRPSLELNLEEEQVGFQLLRRLVDLQAELDALPEGDPARVGKLQALQQGESFLEYLIELQTEYGISNFF